MVKPMYMPDICRGLGDNKVPLTEAQKKTSEALVKIIGEDSFIRDLFRGWSPMPAGRKMTVKGATHD